MKNIKITTSRTTTNSTLGYNIALLVGGDMFKTQYMSLE